MTLYSIACSQPLLTDATSVAILNPHQHRVIELCLTISKDRNIQEQAGIKRQQCLLGRQAFITLS